MANASNYYQIYLNQVIQLAATIVIKSDDIATAINNYVIYLAGSTTAVDQSDPTTWKYYLNLSGQYHSTDTMMTVISYDTLETIDFTIENLQTNTATAAAYQYGTREYAALLAQYPSQEMLIRGILYPVDMDTAISAYDGQILGGYPPALVEVNEYSLIARMQKWVNHFKLRWFNRAYTMSDNLYLTSNLGLMYLNLVPAIITLRLDVCKTNEAHSFHVQQYLASHGFLDQYFQFLTTDQALTFYKNILYIERNPGSQATFEWLVDNLLTVRQLPLAGYTMEHDVSQQPTNFYPNVFFQRTALNLGYNYTTADTLTIDEMLTMEAPVARDNALYQPDVEPGITTQMENSLSNALPTKALDSAMIDYTDSTPYTMEATLTNHWLWLASQGYYQAFVNVDNPQTGERIALSALDAYTFMWYCFCFSVGIELNEVPQVIAQHVQRIPTPTPTDLLSIVDQTVIGSDVAEWLLEQSPVITDLISIDAFYALCQQIWRAQNTQANIVAWQEDYRRRGFADNMFNRIYADAVLTLAPEGQTYTTWFAERNLDLGAWTFDDYGLMYTELAAAATGQNLSTTNSVANLQAAMISMLQSLCSYSVQFMASINSGSIVPLDWPMIRIGNINAEILAKYEFPMLNVRLQRVKDLIHEKINLTTHYPGFDEDLRAKYLDSKRLNVGDMIHSGSPEGSVWYKQIRLNVGVSYTPAPPSNNLGIIPVLGYDTWLALTPEQQGNIADVYGSCWTNPLATTVKLSSAIPNTVLNGLTWVQPTALSVYVRTTALDGFDPAS